MSHSDEPLVWAELYGYGVVAGQLVRECEQGLALCVYGNCSVDPFVAVAAEAVADEPCGGSRWAVGWDLHFEEVEEGPRGIEGASALGFEFQAFIGRRGDCDESSDGFGNVDGVGVGG